jgi:hypothetical protein
MLFVQWLNTLDDLLYELMSWLVFFPITLWRIIRHPLKTLRYAEAQLALEPAEQYRGTVSPPIMMILAILISQALALAIDGTNSIVASKQGMAGLVGDNTTLLLLRIFLFGIFAVAAASWKVHRSDTALDRDSLKPPFYAQCYLVAPFALLLGMGTVGATHDHGGVRTAGLLLAAATLVSYGLVQTLWLKAELGQSLLRSFLDASIIMIISIATFLAVAFLFVS